MSDRWPGFLSGTRVRRERPEVPARSVIVIAPPEIIARLRCLAGDLEIVDFSDLQALERWRNGELVLCHTIRVDVEAALREVGRDLLTLSPKIKAVVDAVSRERSVPGATDLERWFGSRRSLYRAWKAEIPLAPGAFLRRVRTIRAERLIRGGATQKEAAIRAGFGSADRLRRLMKQHRAECMESDA